MVVRRPLSRALALAAVIGPTAASQPSDANQAAWLAFQRRDFPGCERLAREALRLAEAAPDPLQATFAAANVAAAVAMRGRLDEALEWWRRALEHLGPERQPAVRGRILVAQAIVQKLRGEDEASARAFEGARAALAPGDWSLGYAQASARAYDWQDWDEPYERLTKLRDSARAAKDKRRTAAALMMMGWIDGVGEGFAAVKPFEEARTLLAAAGETASLPVVDHNLGTVYLKVGWNDEARAVYERGLAAARAGGDRRLEVMLLDDLSLLFSQQEDWPRAQAADREAALRVAEVAEDVRQGRLEDSLLLDLRRLVGERYAHQPQMLLELFVGLLEQLAVEPRPVDGGR
jgi:tetratricopeptide (TPR) repeat protein